MPVPLAVTLLSTVGPAVAKYIGSRKAAKELTQDPEQIAAQYDELKASMPKFGVGSAWNEYLAMSKRDPAADMQRQIAAEQEASSIRALKAGGAKALLGGLGASQRQAARQRMGIEADSAARKQSALATYGTQQQRAQEANTRMQQQLAESQFMAERDAEQYNRQLEAGKQQALWDGIGSLAGQLGQGNLEGIFGGEGFNNLASELGFNRLNDSERESLIASSFGQTGALPTGEKGMITPGEFSHDSNPIDIMQDGAKVGEMTGGEAILNPEQQKKVAKQSPYFRKLMREFAMRNRK